LQTGHEASQGTTAVLHTYNKNQAWQVAKTNQTESKLENDAEEREREIYFLNMIVNSSKDRGLRQNKTPTRPGIRR
jgi:hypothetical protein